MGSGPVLPLASLGIFLCAFLPVNYSLLHHYFVSLVCSCLLVFFLSSKEATFLWVQFTAAAPGRDMSSHSVSGASLIWQDEWQSPGEEVGSARLLWVVPGLPSPALCTQGLRESGRPQHPGARCTASAALPSWGPEALGHPGVPQGRAQPASVGSGSRAGFGAVGESLGVVPRVTAHPGTCHAINRR